MKMKKVDFSKRPHGLMCLDAMDYVSSLYENGRIKWNVYQKVMDRIRSNLNGNWMFEQKGDKNGTK